MPLASCLTRCVSVFWRHGAQCSEVKHGGCLLPSLPLLLLKCYSNIISNSFIIIHAYLK